jgi:hypothetical protein
MRPIPEIHAEIDELSERRAELWHALSDGHDPAVREELRVLEAQIADLWQEHRATKAALRFGERDRIVARARAEERLERAA